MELRRIPAKSVSLAIATSSGAIYGAGDQVGVAMKISDFAPESRGMAFLRSISIVDKGKQSAATDILFFSEEPVNAVADNAVADISDAEMAAKCIGHVSIAAADYSALNINSVATKQGLGLLLKASAVRSADIWVLVVTRGTPTYASVQDLIVNLSFEQC